MNDFFLKTIGLIPCYPLIGALLSTLWFPSIIRRTGPRPAGYVNIITTLFAFLHGLFALTEIWGQPPQQLIIPWFSIVNLNLDIPLEISVITVAATLVITGLNLLAKIYAVGYIVS
jgi:NAD(P)H-quinone oxidoreductase subunit 5